MLRRATAAPRSNSYRDLTITRPWPSARPRAGGHRARPAPRGDSAPPRRRPVLGTPPPRPPPRREGRDLVSANPLPDGEDPTLRDGPRPPHGLVQREVQREEAEGPEHP